MSKSRFTQAEVRRAVEGAVKGGFAVAGVEIAKDGTIRLLASATKSEQADEREPKEW